MPRKTPAKPGGSKPRRPSPEDLARRAIAHEESAPGNKVRMTLHVMLTRAAAEALAARAIREARNLPTLVEEILEAEASKRRA